MSNTVKKATVVLLAMLCVVACGDEAAFTDPRDGKKYKTVKIGTQTWMAENLNYEAEGSKCYENNPANCAKYGRLYNWRTAMEVCPKGWHLPTNEEWENLVDFAGGEDTAGKKLKAESGWNENGNGTDDFGFSALPGGYDYSGGSFVNVGNVGSWWDATEDGGFFAYLRDMLYDYSFVRRNIGDNKSSLFSVRCVQG